ncbi:MAG: hypothetical protein LBQ79_09970, partial [Deltaproteobacteria bacterium]|nr:hypothetical protein [Deltaproteobacteria bacterium]
VQRPAPRPAPDLPAALAAAAASLGIALCAAALPPSPALAHAVYVFAYPDGDQICTESYFTRRNRVTGGRITMQDQSGTEIESASTGSDGNRCFSAPPGEGDLKFVVLAGEGHRGEFTLPAADRPRPSPAAGTGSGTGGTGSAAPDAAGAAPRPGASPPREAEGAPSGGEASTGSLSGIPEDRLRSIVREELRTQIGPVVRALAEARDDGTPGLREIAGGLGWVAGLFGLVLWLKRRPDSPGRKG